MKLHLLTVMNTGKIEVNVAWVLASFPPRTLPGAFVESQGCATLLHWSDLYNSVHWDFVCVFMSQFAVSEQACAFKTPHAS